MFFTFQIPLKYGIIYPMTEKDKMLAGDWYDANFDPELLAAREKADALAFAFNNTPPTDKPRRATLLAQLFPHAHPSAAILAPVYTDYGTNTTIGEATFINHGAYFMDGAPITIGTHCFIGPNLGCYTAEHAHDIPRRNQGIERARPITIENDCWLGGDVKILPGVTIGTGSIIGAGSIVTKSIPPHSIAVGNPCRVIRPCP